MIHIDLHLYKTNPLLTPHLMAGVNDCATPAFYPVPVNIIELVDTVLLKCSNLSFDLK